MRSKKLRQISIVTITFLCVSLLFLSLIMSYIKRSQFIKIKPSIDNTLLDYSITNSSPYFYDDDIFKIAFLEELSNKNDFTKYKNNYLDVYFEFENKDVYVKIELKNKTYYYQYKLV